MNQKSIDKHFPNFYLNNAMDTFKFIFDFSFGFENLGETRTYVKSLGLNPEFFVYICCCDCWHAVHLQNFQKELVVGNGVLWIRHGNIGAPTKRYVLSEHKEKEIRQLVTFPVLQPFCKSRWNDHLVKDLEEINEGSLECDGKEEFLFTRTGRETVLLHDSLVELGIALFSSPIPVFQLGVVDDYFSDLPPSMWKLWQKGIKTLDPFKDISDVKPRQRPYYLNDWIQELKLRKVMFDGKDPFQVVNETVRHGINFILWRKRKYFSKD